MFYKGDSVRLVRGASESGLPQHAEGTVTNVRRDPGGSPVGAEVQFFVEGHSVVAELPLDALELVVTGAGGCSAVFWRLRKSTELLIHEAVSTMLGTPDQGFKMRQGLNLMQLIYDQQNRFWRKGERFSHESGDDVMAAGSGWDGCVVAFSGRQRFELEFRLRGRRLPYVFLHQRWETYNEQRLTTHPAMTLLRILLNLCQALGADCCAIPVAGNWLMDEDWDSLLRQPYFPDLFIIPESSLPAELPTLFRSQRLLPAGAILTTLPVKFAPMDDSIQRTERELKLDQLRACKAIGEKAYDQIYETHGSTTGLYSDAKEAFYDAIRVARELGLAEDVKELEKRLAHIKAVFRSQFS